LKPGYVDAWINHGVALRQLGRVEKALQCYDTAMALGSNSAGVRNDRGTILKDIGRVEEALADFDAALALNPDFVEAHNNRGVALAEIRRYDEAISCYDAALLLRPELVVVLTNRGNLFQELGQIDQALADYDKAMALDPNSADAVNGRGSILQKLDRTCEAEIALLRAIELRPNYSEAYCNLGSVLIDLGHLAEAELVIRHAVGLKPNSIPALCNLGKVLSDLGRSDEAAAAIQRAVALKPDHPEAQLHLGHLLIKSGRLAEAEAATRRAIELNPNLASAHHNLGVALMEIGRLAEAREAAERAVALAPREPLHFRQLGEVRQYLAGDSYLTTLEALSKDETSLGITKQIDLNFALAKACADIGHREDEFHRLLTGNRLKRSRINYDETSALSEIDRMRDVFSTEFMRTTQVAGENSPKPIFIVGMPRSGTSLVEQILASHPQVFGAGELKLLERSIRDISSSMQEVPDYPRIAQHMTAGHFGELGVRYLAGIEQLAPTASRITDKMPANFQFVGLIHMALPCSTIIHTVRDPADTCISCFSKLFTEGNFHTYDLAELGRYYRRYESLMAHWHRVLPPGRILDVHYEDTVTDVEATARRIVAHCGLPWDQCCLDFHRIERAVRTSSAAQVRRPIYASSVGRRHVYGPLLKPLLAELVDLR
jgi:tetratricopeptide (TPR) repeat protein